MGRYVRPMDILNKGARGCSAATHAARNAPVEPREAVQRPQLREVDDDGHVHESGVRGPRAVAIHLRGTVRGRVTSLVERRHSE